MATSSNQYVSIQGWMGKSGLSLSGPSLIIYAIIYGFSQDGATACRCHLSYFEEWADICERTARSIISDLVGAGYIHRTALGEGRGALVEYRANLEIAAEAQKGAKFAPIIKGAIFSKKGAKSCTKGGKICRVDNNMIIYDNIVFSSTHTRAEDAGVEERRKEEIFKLFFFKNSADPSAEVDAFYRVNMVGGWRDDRGRKIDTSLQQLLAWADGWVLKNGTTRVNEYFLSVWREIYNEAARLSDPIAPKLIDTAIGCTSDNSTVTLIAPAAVAEWFEARLKAADNRIFDLWVAFLRKRTFRYAIPNKEQGHEN